MSLEFAFGGLRLPHGYKQIPSVFGDPTGGGKFSCVDVDHVDPAWRRAHIVECHAGSERGPMPGLEAFYFECNVLAEPVFRQAYTEIAKLRRGAIKRAASFVPRRMRHDTPARAAARHNHPPLLPFSTHLWGIAGDNDSDLNDAEYDWHHAPWSPEWLARWPHGLAQDVVEIFEGLGFAWGGRWPGFVDPMHVELVYHADGVHPHDAAAAA